MRTLISILIVFVFSNISHSQTKADTVKTATIKIGGIACNMDMPIIKKKLLNQEGVDEATYSEAKSGSVIFTVKYHSSIITEKKIREVIEAAPSCDNPNELPYKVKSFKAGAPKKQQL